MNKVIKFFLNGTVIFLIAVPFLFCSKSFGQDVVKLKLKGDGVTALTYVARNEGSINEIAALTSFARKLDSLVVDSLKSDTNMTVVKPKDPVIKKFRMRKSPTTAVLLSAVLPGAGQFYNESYWKVPIIGGLVGYFAYEYFRNNNLYKDYRNDYSASQTEINPDGDITLKTLREFYRDQRDDFVWYFLIVYVINMVDAYVDAHLFDFDVRDEKFSKYGTRGKEYRLKFKMNF
jgi:hypothetical protein